MSQNQQCSGRPRSDTDEVKENVVRSARQSSGKSPRHKAPSRSLKTSSLIWICGETCSSNHAESKYNRRCHRVTTKERPVDSHSTQLCLTVFAERVRSISGSTDTSTPMILGVASRIAFMERNQNHISAEECRFDRKRSQFPKGNQHHFQPPADSEATGDKAPEGPASSIFFRYYCSCFRQRSCQWLL